MEDLEGACHFSDEGRVTAARSSYLRLLEGAGVRRLYMFIAGAVQEPVLPSVDRAPETKGWSEEQLEERRSGSRYFGNANLIRAALHLPVVVFGVLYDFESLVTVFALLALCHVLLALVESYKAGIVTLIPADDKGSEIDHFVPANFAEGWFAPRSWETEKLYTWIGIRPFQALTTFLIKHIWLTKQERSDGKQVEYLRSMSPTQVLRFEIATRVGEMVHMTMGLIDAVPLVIAVLIGPKWGWVLYFAWIFWGDTWLGLLQRYHRLRVWKLVQRCRKKLEVREEKSA